MSFSLSQVTVENKSYGENDEGDYDEYTIHVFSHGGECFLTVRSSSSSNCSGCWGKTHSILPGWKTSGELRVQTKDVSGDISTGRQEENKGITVYNLEKEWKKHQKRKES